MQSYRFFLSLHTKYYSNKYATKKVRMDVATLAQNKIDSMVLVYEFANYMNVAGFFDSAINGYNYIKEFYPGKEIYNNTAIAYANYVQAELPLFSLDSPNYIYPMYIDRLAGFSGSRTNDIEFDAEKIKLRANYLNLALQNLDEAILLDPNYATAQINRLCILFLQGKRENILSQINTLKSSLKKPLDLEKLSIMESIIYLQNGQKNKAILLLNDLLDSKNEGIKTMAQSNLNIAEEIEIVVQNARCSLQFDETIDNEKSQEKPFSQGRKPIFLQKNKNSNHFYFKKSKTELESTIYLLAEPHRERSIWAQRFRNSITPIAKGIAVGSNINVALQSPMIGKPTILNWHCGKYYHFQDCKVIIVTNHKDQIIEWLRYDVY